MGMGKLDMGMGGASVQGAELDTGTRGICAGDRAGHRDGGASGQGALPDTGTRGTSSRPSFPITLL